MAAPLALLGPAVKMLASQGVKKAAMETAKGVAKDKAKNFVTGKGRKKKGKKGKGGALVKSEGGQEEESQESGGAIVPTTPIVGKYRVETPPPKPDEVGKPSKISYEAINNQLDSIVALTGVLKKTSMSKMKTANNRRKAERKAEEKAKQRDRESLLERGAVGAIGAVGGAVSKAAPFDPLKFFTMIFLGSLLTWIMTHGSKITAFLKMTLALMNNFGKLVKLGFTALKNVFKLGFKTIGKLASPLLKVGKGLKTGIKAIGNKLAGAFGRVGNGLKNLAKGVINKIKAAGKILSSPLKALQKLTGPEKKAVKTNKGLNKLLQQGGTGSQNLGTATRKPGTLSNATKSMRLKHGDEAARMYQGLVDNGMKPAKAAQYVNKSISSGKLTSAPLEGTLAGGKKGSQLLKGGAGRSTNRIITKLGGKNALKMTKALKGALSRIPIVGPLITLVVSLLDPDVSVNQALFRTAGAVVGGFLGTFIPIPVVGTLFGEIIGEYIGDLTYIAMNDGGVEAVGQKLKDDLTAALSVGQKAMDWVGDGFGRLYEGIPKVNIPWPINKEFPNPVWMANPLNLMEKLGVFHKAFFTNDPMEKGEEEVEGTEETSGNVTNVSTVRRDTEGARAGDFIMASDGTLGVFDGRGTRGLREGEKELFDSGAINIDGTRPTPKPKKMMTEDEYHTARVEDYSLPDTYEEYVSEFTGTSPQISPQTPMFNLGSTEYGEGPLLRAAKEAGYEGKELAAFMAQMAHESGNFRYRREISGGRSDYDGGGPYTLPDGKVVPAIYHGRGYIQLTHKYNYKEYGDKLGVDLVNNPELAMQGDIAAKIAVLYWNKNVRPTVNGDWDNVFLHSKAINYPAATSPSQVNGMADRQAKYDQYLEKYGSSQTTGSSYETQGEVPGTPLPRGENQNQGESVSPSSSPSTPTPAQVTPPAQSQMSSGISGISKQLPYEETGGTTVVMASGSNRGGGMMGGGRSAGTPVIMGSGDVVNSYYKSQLLGFLYKQG